MLPPPPPKPPRKSQKLQFILNLLSTTPLPLMLHPKLPMILLPNYLFQQSPTLHIHWEFAINILKLPPTPQTPRKTWKWMIKILSTIPPPPTLFPLFYQSIPHNNLSQQPPNPHIYWEIATSITAKTPQKNPKIQLMIKLLSTTPLTPTLHPPLKTMPPSDLMDQQSPNIHIHWEITINISKSPRH